MPSIRNYDPATDSLSSYFCPPNYLDALHNRFGARTSDHNGLTSFSAAAKEAIGVFASCIGARWGNWCNAPRGSCYIGTAVDDERWGGTHDLGNPLFVFTSVFFYRRLMCFSLYSTARRSPRAHAGRRTERGFRATQGLQALQAFTTPKASRHLPHPPRHLPHNLPRSPAIAIIHTQVNLAPPHNLPSSLPPLLLLTRARALFQFSPC